MKFERVYVTCVSRGGDDDGSCAGDLNPLRDRDPGVSASFRSSPFHREIIGSLSGPIFSPQADSEKERRPLPPGKYFPGLSEDPEFPDKQSPISPRFFVHRTPAQNGLRPERFSGGGGLRLSPPGPRPGQHGPQVGFLSPALEDGPVGLDRGGRGLLSCRACEEGWIIP